MDLQTILTSFSLGLLATTSPCVLPLYPGFLAYLAGRRKWRIVRCATSWDSSSWRAC
jgi:cytochrome c biogenesis protein CcdA